MIELGWDTVQTIMLFHFFSCASAIVLSFVSRRFWKGSEGKCVSLPSSSVLFRQVPEVYATDMLQFQDSATFSFCSTWLWQHFTDRSAWHLPGEICCQFPPCPPPQGTQSNHQHEPYMNPSKRCSLDWFYSDFEVQQEFGTVFLSTSKKRFSCNTANNVPFKKITSGETHIPCPVQLGSQNPGQRGNEKRTDTSTVKLRSSEVL